MTSPHTARSSFYDRVYHAVRTVPAGQVATYGQIAAMAGSPKASRCVGNALHENPDPETIPCHRVVNVKGKLAAGFAFGGLEGQARRLRSEGVEVTDGRVDLSRFGYTQGTRTGPE